MSLNFLYSGNIFFFSNRQHNTTQHAGYNLELKKEQYGDASLNTISYGRKFWRGIYFGRLAVLRAIRQYFIRQIAAQCDVIIIAKSYQCVYTRPAARRASLIVGIEFTIKSCVRRHHFSKEFIVPRWEKSWLVCQGEEGDPNDVYAVLQRPTERK